MHARHRTFLFSGIAASLAVGLMATAAYAAGGSAHPAGGQRATAATWSVYSQQGSAGVSARVELTDNTTGNKIKCGANFGYSFTRKMRLPSDIATLSGVQFGNCKLPDGTAITLTSNTRNLPMMALSFNRLRNLGVTTGEFTGIDVSLSSSGCSGILDGTAAGANDGTVPYRYYNNPEMLITSGPGDLHIYNVTGCAGLFNTGDPFTLSSTQGQGIYGLTITSP